MVTMILTIAAVAAMIRKKRRTMVDFVGRTR